MHAVALQPDSAWAEDRALLRSNPSADPGAKTEGQAVASRRRLTFLPFGIGTNALNLRGTTPRLLRQDAFTHHSLTLTDQEFQFTVNQDKLIGALMVQIHPNDHLTLRADFQRLVYEALQHE